MHALASLNRSQATHSEGPASCELWVVLQIYVACFVQVVCATCAGAGDDERLQMRRYKMVIIDEATQATEPSNIIPLVRIHASHVLWPVLHACSAWSHPSDWPRRRSILLLPGAVLQICYSEVALQHLAETSLCYRPCKFCLEARCRMCGDEVMDEHPWELSFAHGQQHPRGLRSAMNVWSGVAREGLQASTLPAEMQSEHEALMRR